MPNVCVVLANSDAKAALGETVTAAQQLRQVADIWAIGVGQRISVWFIDGYLTLEDASRP